MCVMRIIPCTIVHSFCNSTFVLTAIFIPVYTMGELKMTGNCLKGSRPLLSFDENFTTNPHFSLLKELFTQIFGVPNRHPKSQPFFDHVYTFSVLDNRIWFRNFQILTEDGGLAEIGPRFVLNPVKIFSGSFGGETLWDNPHYISPAKVLWPLTKTLQRLVNKRYWAIPSLIFLNMTYY